MSRKFNMQKSIYYCTLETTSGFKVQLNNQLINGILRGTLHLV